MATQLAIADDIQPRKFTMHVVRKRRSAEMAAELSLLWEPIATGPKGASIFSLPWPGLEEPRPAKVSGLSAHWCGLGKHYVWCLNVKRCTLPAKAPCSACEEAVSASYRAGKYAR